MKQQRVNALVFVALLAAASAGSAQTVANGPYYAIPSWDQTMPASARFVVLANMNNEAVLDRETGLVWERALSFANGNFGITMQRCIQKSTGARTGWRVPTVYELMSVFDPTAVANGVWPPLPAGHPFTNFPTTLDIGWSLASSTKVSDGVHYALLLDQFSFTKPPSVTVNLSANPDTNGTSHAWCVRGGAPAGPQ